MFGGFGGYGGSRFEASYRCYPVSFLDKPEAERGDKIFLPPSALDRLGEPQPWKRRSETVQPPRPARSQTLPPAAARQLTTCPCCPLQPSCTSTTPCCSRWKTGGTGTAPTAACWSSLRTKAWCTCPTGCAPMLGSCLPHAHVSSCGA